MPRILLSLLGLTVLFAAYPYGRWDIKAKNQFQKTDCLMVALSFEGSTICDLDSADFVDSTPAFSSNRYDGLWRIKRFHNRFMHRMTASHSIDGLKIIPFDSDSIPSSFVLKIDIESISENGGIFAQATLIETASNKAKEMQISVSDGRWNSEDKLFMEAADKLAQLILNKLNYLRGYPAKAFDW